MHIASFVHNSVVKYVFLYISIMKEYFFAGVVLSILLLVGCQTLISKEYPGKDWQYHVKTDKVGENRGIQWGYLFYKGRELESYFNTVVIQKTRYDFTIKTETPGDWIWVKRENIEAYLDPSKMYALISKYKISRILDGNEDLSPFRVRMGFAFGRRF